MHLRVVTPLIVVALFAASCNQPPSQPPTLAAQASRAAAGANVPGTPTATASKAATPIPPKDAQYTIYCTSISGINHVEQAKQVKADLLKMTQLSDWYVIHGEDESVLYYGFYRSVNNSKDAKESARAQQDRKAVISVPDRMDNRPFARAMFVNVNAPDPTAPPEWNLTNAKGYWSLQIAAYKDSPQRKQAAVEAVREARARGIDAYYYHGQTSSSVCIGAWPREALKEQDDDEARTIDPEQPILVLPNPLPFNSPVDVREKNTGEKVRTLVPRVEPIDPTLIAAMTQYPEHSINGEVTYKTGKDTKGVTHQVPDHSFLVEIPKREPSIFGTNEVTVQAAPPQSIPSNLAPTPPPPPQRPVPGASGRLRSIGD